MAVCGRCLICGYKFDGDTTPDVAVRWTCSRGCPLNWDGVSEHAICSGCHDILVGAELHGAVRDLLALIRERREF